MGDTEQKQGNLVLSRKTGERLVIEDTETGKRMTIEAAECKYGKVRLCFNGPPTIKVYREELLSEMQTESNETQV